MIRFGGVRRLVQLFGYGVIHASRNRMLPPWRYRQSKSTDGHDVGIFFVASNKLRDAIAQ